MGWQHQTRCLELARSTRIRLRETHGSLFQISRKNPLNYERGFFKSGLSNGANDFIIWGKIKPRIGYLSILAMGDYAGFEASRAESLAVLETTMDQVLESFRSVEAVAVDVRFNTGGYDADALLIANRFADRRRLAFTQKAVYGQGFTEKQEFYVSPQGSFQFTGPTFLLTSERTVSAAESFVLGLMAFPHVTRVGTTTAGAFSNVLTKYLPNGWRVEMSNEVCEAADGRVYEGVGIPPQVEVPVFIPGHIYPGLKEAVDKAAVLAERAIAKKAIGNLERPLGLRTGSTSGPESRGSIRQT
jgi:C-terminal processing protease CtpA/Prc